jgi:hypothetical protein
MLLAPSVSRKHDGEKFSQRSFPEPWLTASGAPGNLGA